MQVVDDRHRRPLPAIATILAVVSEHAQFQMPGLQFGFAVALLHDVIKPPAPAGLPIIAKSWWSASRFEHITILSSSDSDVKLYFCGQICAMGFLDEIRAGACKLHGLQMVGNEWRLS